MSAHSLFELMLQEFGNEIGHALALDEQGICVLELNADTDCLIAMPPGSEAARFCVNVLPMPGKDQLEVTARFFAHLLSQNIQDPQITGASLGLDPTNTQVLARYDLPVERMRSGDIAPIVTNLGAMAQRLRDSLQAWHEDNARHHVRIGTQSHRGQEGMKDAQPRNGGMIMPHQRV